MTLLFAILTIIINITKTRHINMRTYVVGVFVQARII